MRRKLNVQLIILTLCIAIPVVALIAFFGIRNNRMQLQERLAQDQAAVQGQMAQIDSMLELLEHALAYLSVDDTQLHRIAQAQIQDTQFWIDNNALLRRLQSQTQISGLDVIPFIYFPSQDIFYNEQMDPPAAEAIRKIADRKEEFNSGSWSRLDLDDTTYLYILLPYKEYQIGAWIPFSALLHSLPVGEGERLFITDIDGYVLSESHEMTLAADGQMLMLENETWYRVDASASQGEFRLAKLIRKQRIDAQLSSIGVYVLIVAGIFAILLMAYLFFLNIWILKPVRHLRTSMETIRSGDLEYRIAPLHSASEEFCSMIDEFNHLMDSIRDLKISIYESELEQKEVRLAYLSRQIQPHFILNSLNTLYNHSGSDADTTREIVRLISGYYRYVVNVNSTYVRLGQELDHIDQYLSLQMLRYPGLFSYEILCEEHLRAVQVPPFIVESFVGNIFKHGFIPGEHNLISVTVHTLVDIGMIQIRIEDNGNGFSDDSLDAIRDFLDEGITSEELGVGIRNSIERLQLIYKDNCRIDIYNKPDHGAVVVMEVPEIPESGISAEFYIE